MGTFNSAHRLNTGRENRAPRCGAIHNPQRFGPPECTEYRPAGGSSLADELLRVKEPGEGLPATTPLVPLDSEGQSGLQEFDFCGAALDDNKTAWHEGATPAEALTEIRLDSPSPTRVPLPMPQFHKVRSRSAEEAGVSNVRAMTSTRASLKPLLGGELSPDHPPLPSTLFGRHLQYMKHAHVLSGRNPPLFPSDWKPKDPLWIDSGRLSQRPEGTFEREAAATRLAQLRMNIALTDRAKWQRIIGEIHVREVRGRSRAGSRRATAPAQPEEVPVGEQEDDDGDRELTEEEMVLEVLELTWSGGALGFPPPVIPLEITSPLSTRKRAPSRSGL
ncbi:uncharacterized protein BXZ73DRAFT_80479 [Epithele typhae]|uniref:uncharacterized protein n=1 Tax=Epithele typhae TaxID=378194 RepID=UPI0020072398|nr:uncharacterized protein BXZ73DRAFT_80479 [Epithele typhae]KAH9918943.1 hypothetical protein BXZ73DRAFT_80479 [Epithele typhae]